MAGYLYSIVPENHQHRASGATSASSSTSGTRRSDFPIVEHVEDPRIDHGECSGDASRCSLSLKNSLTRARALTLSAAAHNLFDTLKHTSASTHPLWLQIAQNLTTSPAVFRRRVS
jgi:hypothetical protein